MVSPQCVYLYGYQGHHLKKTLITNATFIYFLPTVYQLVPIRTYISWQRLSTITALIWFLPSMHSKMVSKKRFFLWKSLHIMNALIGHLLSVQYQMSTKITLLWENHSTIAELKMFVTIMYHQIAIKTSLSQEILVTLVTLKGVFSNVYSIFSKLL